MKKIAAAVIVCALSLPVTFASQKKSGTTPATAQAQTQTDTSKAPKKTAKRSHRKHHSSKANPSKG